MSKQNKTRCTAVCEACAANVVWIYQFGVKGKRDTWQCFNDDGVTVHWDQCSQRKFEAIKATGRPFENIFSTGYYTDLKPSGVQLTRHSIGAIRGDKYRPSSDCKNCVPPWERCEQCPNQLEAR